MPKARLAVLGFLIASCTPSAVITDQTELQKQVVPFTAIFDPQGVKAGEREIRRVITSAKQYWRLIGHQPPADVNFDGGETVVLYAAGTKRTGGYTASVQSIEFAYGTLAIVTRLESPGHDCLVTLGLTHPFALVKLRQPIGVQRVRFERDDVTRKCANPETCDDIRCPDGQSCSVKPVLCVRQPCPPVARCMPDLPQPVICGGIAGIQCPGVGECQDDPSDDCDPRTGGADCSGVCHCTQQLACKRGTAFDPSPSVCQCVHDPSQDPCAVVRCRAGHHCEADCGNVTCVPDAPFCGGIAGFPCPGAGTCVDNPADDCDPNHGGADCGGLCQCNALGFCVPGYVWDSSPEVCNCVSVTDPCAVTLCQTGTECKVINGAAVCVSNGALACGTNVCDKGLVCCNASCGACTAPGMFCTQQACLP
jgi:PrcB C-terminal